MLDRSRVQNPFYTPEHEAFRDVMRRFVAREIEPYAHEWDEAGEFPRELYAKAAEIGLLGLGFPEEFGGVPADQFMKIVASQELARAGAGGVSSSLMSHTIGSPPLGSVIASAEIFLPASTSGNTRAFTSGRAARAIGGEPMVWLIRLALTPPAPARASSCEATIFMNWSAGTPPHSSGKPSAKRPMAAALA